MVWLCGSCLDQLRTIAREKVWLQLQPSQRDIIDKYDGDHEDIFSEIIERMTDSLYNDLDQYADVYFQTEETDWMHQMDSCLDKWEEDCKEEEGEDE